MPPPRASLRRHVCCCLGQGEEASVDGEEERAKGVKERWAAVDSKYRYHTPGALSALQVEVPGGCRRCIEA